MGIAETLPSQPRTAGQQRTHIRLSLGSFVGFLLEMEVTVIYADF